MTSSMDNSAPSAGEIAQRLYRKNIELENGLRKSAQLKVPSDPNAWIQMRENYEAIILEDHDFSEKHGVESALWKLHYKRIEEFRAHINVAKSAVGSITSQGGKNLAQSDRIKKVRAVFKSFLSEATGFYHDLILKIRAKYGLPLGDISEALENQVNLAKDHKKSVEMKKGFLSWHRCMIYLGDLARYKGLYGGDSAHRDYAGASCYYVQAASLWPSSGNSHHQLAILALYSGNDLVAVYRYFRSLAVDSPFATARDNLIVAFEKNRQSYSQLPSNAKIPLNEPTRDSGAGRGRRDTRPLDRIMKQELTHIEGEEFGITEVFKVFSAGFVRLNGILFTRTSLQTFGEIFSSVISNLYELLSSGPEEALNFGQDTAENGLVILRLITMLIFSVNNVKSESEGQSYAEILKRSELLQKAFSVTFEFVGHILKRCTQLYDIPSSYLLPAILVFMEWLACHPDIVTRINIEEKETTARSFFWNQCISLMNRLLLSGLVCVDGDEDTTCFSDMSLYDEGETGNRLALWEDFELRGFSPLVPAQLILDFSRKHFLGSDRSTKEKKARVERILAAGKSLMHAVMVDHQGVYYDSNLKKFVIGTKPPRDDEQVQRAFMDASEIKGLMEMSSVGKTGITQSNKVYLELPQSKEHLIVEGEEEEEEEEIVFKPAIAEKYPIFSVSKSILSEGLQPTQDCSNDGLVSYRNRSSFSVPLNNLAFSTPPLDFSSQLHATVPNSSQSPFENISVNTSKWIVEQQSFLTNELKNLHIAEHGLSANPISQGFFNGLKHTSSSPFFSSAATLNLSSALSSQNNVETIIPSKLDSMVPLEANFDDLGRKSSAPLPVASRKNPVSRPVRHLGPPPGFNTAPARQLDDSLSKSVVDSQLPQMDDYSWLDGYQASSEKGTRMDDSINHSAHLYSQFATSNNNIFTGAMDFPFPGKLVSTMEIEPANVKKWQNFQSSEHGKLYHEQQLPHVNQLSSLPQQYQAQPQWSSRYFV